MPRQFPFRAFAVSPGVRVLHALATSSNIAVALAIDRNHRQHLGLVVTAPRRIDQALRGLRHSSTPHPSAAAPLRTPRCRASDAAARTSSSNEAAPAAASTSATGSESQSPGARSGHRESDAAPPCGSADRHRQRVTRCSIGGGGGALPADVSPGGPKELAATAQRNTPYRLRPAHRQISPRTPPSPTAL